MNNSRKLLNKQMFYRKNFFKEKKFLVYGLGITGVSVANFLKKRKINFCVWDDNPLKRKTFFKNNFIKEKNFKKIINSIDHIILSPGISIINSRFKYELSKSKKKILTDLDIFYILNPNIKTIVVTGSNGKSTTCKLIEHILKKNNIKTQVGGNIGKPILDNKIKKKITVIIEASSFQLAYSQFIKPTYAIILNVSNDHLDWHKTKKNYINSKFRIFSNQEKKDFAFFKDKKLIKIYKKKKYQGKLKLIKSNNFNLIKSKISNIYLKSKINEENLNFVYDLIKQFNINKKKFIYAINTFKGLEHRHETVYVKSGVTFINDSKGTSFESTKLALSSNKNIYWIVGGKPKLGDKFQVSKFKSRILKTYIIGKNTSFFSSQLQNKIKFKISYTLRSAIFSIFKDLKKHTKETATVLFSPAAASYDQYKNFSERGNEFKKIINNYRKNG